MHGSGAPIASQALAPPTGSYPPLRRARGPLSVPWNRGTPYYRMKARSPRGYLLSRGKQRPTPPRGQLQGRHAAREDDILQGIVCRSGPPWEVSDPCIYGMDLRVKSKTPAGMNRTPGMGLGPLCVGSGPLTVESWDSGTKSTQTLIKTRRGSRANTCPDHAVYASAPRSGGDLMLPRAPLPVM
jgi:hypothetical protein